LVEQERNLMRYFIGFFAALGVLAVLIVTAGGVGVYWFAGNFSDPPSLPGSIVLKARLSGPVAEVSDTSPLGELFPARRRLSLLDMVSTIDTSVVDSRVQGLVMDLSASRLDLAEAQELRAAILRFRAAGKFTHVFTDTFEGPSAAATYFLATAFEIVSLQPSGLLDVRGVSLTTPLMRRLLDEQGVRAEIHTRHEFKSAAVPLTKEVLPEPVRENYQRVVTSMYEQLVTGIANARGLSPSEVRKMIDATPLVARAARRDNLVDTLAYWDQMTTMAEAHAPTARLVDWRRYSDARALDTPEKPDTRIAVISVEGEIIRGRGNSLQDRDKAAAGRLISAIRAADDDPSVKAILLRIDSPGGSYTASDSILRTLDQVRAGGLPVVVSMGSLAASGGYFITLAADHIVAHPASITGSIGVLGGKVSFGELLSRHGVDSAEVSAGANATMYSPLHPFNERQRERLAVILDEIYADFTTKVAQRRRLTLSELDAAARGRIWTGEDALRLGLVDALGGFDEAVSLARKFAKLEPGEPANLTIFPRRSSLLDEVLDAIEGGDLTSLALGLRDLTRLIGYAVQATRVIPNPAMSEGIMLRAPHIFVR
jgi:protease-4